VGFVYPHWSLGYDVAKTWIDACRRAGKPFIAYEYGWDRTNLPTQTDLRRFLATLHALPNVAGDAFWALEAHADGHGWLPIPADTDDPVVAATGESGQWWALYWPGITTLVNTASDMTARALIIRAHNFAMRGVPPPPLPLPRAPTGVTAAPDATGVRVLWQGSVGAARYSVERAASAAGPWQTICRGCATDAGDGYLDTAAPPVAAWYRVVPLSLAGRAGAPSRPVQAS
jgi:hypothetical protein